MKYNRSNSMPTTHQKHAAISGMIMATFADDAELLATNTDIIKLKTQHKTTAANPILENLT